MEVVERHQQEHPTLDDLESVKKALVIGIGPIGRQIASRFETLGLHVCLIDLSPINLHPFAQLDFHTVAGDAREHEVLRRADAAHCRLAVVSVPDEEAVIQIVRALRETNREMFIVVRCRFLATVVAAKKAGANWVVSEEQEASEALLELCENVVGSSDARDR